MRTPLGSAPTVDQLVAAIAGGDRPFVLHGRWGLDDDAPADERVVVASVAPTRAADPRAADPFAALGDTPKLLGEALGGGFIGGGWVGWLGFELGRRVEPSLSPQPPRPSPLAALQLGWFDNVVRRDAAGRWWVEGLAPAGAGDAWLAERADAWRARFAAAAPVRKGQLGTMRVSAPGAAGHRAAVSETVERIAAGELFQANVCLRLEGPLHGDAAGLVAPVMAATDPWYGAWIDGGRHGIVSASPELFLRRRGVAVRTAPIKGTAPREAGVLEPDAAAEALQASGKDAAEHVMIVDLMRNDLGRVCDYGSIRADAAPRLEAHAGVWHLVSHVSGRLHAGLGDGRLVRACFPPGSVTGAPKVQAQRVISAVEASGREVYTGAHGIVGPACGLELAVTIRTIEHQGPVAWVGAGGGIVADSTPGGELEEALRKASALVTAAGGTIERPSAADARPPNPRGARWLASTARRPDPAAGLIETILVTDGHLEHLDRHLARLEESVAAGGFAPLPPNFATTLRARAAGSHGRRRLRIQLSAAAMPRLELLPIADAGGSAVLLAPWVVPGGLGRHKWADRRLLDELAADREVPLLIDADGTVLEASYANLWWHDRAGLWTPPADRRLLPGVSRGVLLELGDADGVTFGERAVTLEELAAAPIVLTSARGAQPARLASTPAPAVLRAAELAALMTAALADPPD